MYIHGHDNVTQQEWVATFWPRVDEFSQLTVVGNILMHLHTNSSSLINDTLSDRPCFQLKCVCLVGIEGIQCVRLYLYCNNLQLLHSLHYQTCNFRFLPNNRTLSPKRVYSEDLNELLIPYFTAVVLLNNGNVQSFDWSDGCSSYCNPVTDCLDDFCGNHRNSSGVDRCTESDCDIKVTHIS